MVHNYTKCSLHRYSTYVANLGFHMLQSSKYNANCNFIVDTRGCNCIFDLCSVSFSYSKAYISSLNKDTAINVAVPSFLWGSADLKFFTLLDITSHTMIITKDI